MTGSVGRRPVLTRFGSKKTFAGRSVKQGTTKRAVHPMESGRKMKKMIPLKSARSR